MLHIHRAESASTLAGVLAAMLSEPLPDPFAAEIVAIGAHGVQRWLTQRLATTLGAVAGDGICANIAYPAPAALIADICAAAADIAPADDPWSPDRLVWPVLAALDEAIGEPWAAVPARHLGMGRGRAEEYRTGRRLATAAHIAALFDHYGSTRPSLITEWAESSGDTDGCGAPLPEDLLWQPQLWRRVRARIGTPSPAERLAGVCDRVRGEPASIDLPQRLSLFAPHRVPAAHLAVLAAVAEHRDVHVWLVHPSPALWDAGDPAPGGLVPAGVATAVRAAPAVRRRAAADPLTAHPLLAALGRDMRELRSRLATVDFADTYHEPVPGENASGTVLSDLQSDIRAGRPPRPTPGGADDATVQIHACHGPARQIEVLRDVLLGLFERDRTLEPRDVIVLCPDPDGVAPLVRAAFGQGPADEPDPDPAHGLRVRPAERRAGSANTVLAVLDDLLGLAEDRIGVTQILDLAATEPVRHRCGFDDDDIERLREWAAETGARWGIGQRQRQAFGLADFAQNTLNAAVDRILLGVAAGESGADWLDLALPLEDVDSGDVELAGRFAEFVDRLAVCVRDFGGPTAAEPAGTPRPARQWSQILHRALDLLTDLPPAAAWQGVQARREIAAVFEHAGETELRLPDVATALRARTRARTARSNYRTGELTVCGLAPMRAVPHRVVVLLGLDDEVFPRTGAVDGDDVTAREPLVGERDPRSEDRGLLLDAVLAAREHLVVLYTGADPVTGVVRPPVTPLAELIDVVRAHRGTGEVVRRHPLQAYDRRNFDANDPFGFDTLALAAAEAAARPARPAPPWLPAALPAPARTDVELSELVSFAEHPIRAFLWQRLGIRVPEEDEDIDERLPIELSGLASWNIGERMLAARLTGADPADLRAAEWRRGTLPPFGLGAAVLSDVESTVDRLVEAAAPLRQAPARTIDVAVDLGSGRRLTGTVADVHDDALIRATYSRLAPKHRMAAWVRLLALAATERHQGWRAVGIGRGRFGRPAWRSTLTAPDAATAAALLADLADLRDEGLAEPLPFGPASSALYAERRCRGADLDEALAAAEEEFFGGPKGPRPFGDHTDRYLTYIWGPDLTFERLTAPLPKPDRHGETTVFGSVARRMWNPLLAGEAQGQP
ncbi:exodeoxyribonuclease V gamma chain [Nocardia nova SH22a]|uniref:RecBCD enzyme subunit RecC n=1 Tax=Nocardia nova SH22a TaxID=1415166 RepID=W5TFV9_9NOCA|nr:exodeoxyribonuclease V subunit gamma [Nocardia nova]AHH18049.1 exodeoxyribonuclease V gamma chain [Nocardia nova SH22a]